MRTIEHEIVINRRLRSNEHWCKHKAIILIICYKHWAVETMWHGVIGQWDTL